MGGGGGEGGKSFYLGKPKGICVAADYGLFNCPPPSRRKARGHSIRLSVVRGAEFVVGTL